MRQVNMLEAKTQLSKLVEMVESGAETEILIARDGKPAARLVSVNQTRKPIRLGLARDKFPDFDMDAFKALDADVEKLFLGDDA